MWRRLFNFATAGSLLMCVAASALWVRSLTHFEQVYIRYARWPHADEYRLASVNFAWYSNTLRLDVTHFTRLPSRFREFFGQSEAEYEQRMKDFRATNPPGLRWRFNGVETTGFMNGYPPGFRVRHSPYRDDPARPGDSWILAVRPWLPTVLTAALPAMWIYRFWKTRRARRRGLCPSCGYDLRATPARCPECGAMPEARPATAA